MKYCGYCGKEMPEDMLYCTSCGKNQDSADSAIAQSQSAERTNEHPLPKTRTTRKLWGIPIAFLTILLLVIAAVLLYPKSFSENTKKINEAAQSVVMLSCYDDSDNLLSTGSGFIAISDDIVVTNFHVIRNSLKIRVSTEQDKSYEVTRVLAYDESSDIAILQLSQNTGLTILRPGNSNKIRKGEKVTAIGSPLGIKNTVSTGILSGRIWNSVSSLDELQFTAPISSGSSGGALFDESGRVIGVTYASFIDGQNLNLAIPVEQIDVIYNAKDTAINVEEFHDLTAIPIRVGIRTIALDSHYQALKLRLEWDLSGGTEETIIDLMNQYGPEQGGGQLYIIEQGDFIEEIDDWCFTPGRQIGDIEVIENTYGFSICYISSLEW